MQMFLLLRRRDGRVVDCTGLENQRTERCRGFESLSLRQRIKSSLRLQRGFFISNRTKRSLSEDWKWKRPVLRSRNGMPLFFDPASPLWDHEVILHQTRVKRWSLLQGVCKWKRPVLRSRNGMPSFFDPASPLWDHEVILPKNQIPNDNIPSKSLEKKNPDERSEWSEFQFFAPAQASKIPKKEKLAFALNKKTNTASGK